MIDFDYTGTGGGYCGRLLTAHLGEDTDTTVLSVGVGPTFRGGIGRDVRSLENSSQSSCIETGFETCDVRSIPTLSRPCRSSFMSGSKRKLSLVIGELNEQ